METNQCKDNTNEMLQPDPYNKVRMPQKEPPQLDMQIALNIISHLIVSEPGPPLLCGLLE